ncbi:MAG: mandelate racemase/muconate lactonizing enzyme family protein [Chloroflexota bacterium]
MSKITAIQTDHYRIPLPVVLTDSTHGEMSHFELVTVRLRDEHGVEGMGYTYTVDAGGGAIHAVIERELKPLLLGQDASRIEQLWEEMWWKVHFVGRSGIVAFAIAAVDVALWDLKGNLFREPLWKLLGGHSPVVKGYAGGIDLMFPLEQLLEQAQSFQEKGFRAIKMKVGRDQLSEDVARVSAMRDFLGPDFPLMVDANMRWSVAESIRASRALADYDVYWLEEPTIPDDIEGYRRIATEGLLPVANGENLHSLYEFQKIIAGSAVSFPEPDLATLGGITVWMKVAHLAEAFNLPVTTHGVHDLHVHLLAAVPNASYLEAHGFGLERFMEHPMIFKDGVTLAPDRPGHGISLDWDQLAASRNEN